MSKKEEAQLILRVKAIGQKAFGVMKMGISGIKKGLQGLGGVIVGVTGLAVKNFVDFEKGLIGVGKTTGIAGAELRNLGKDIREMSTRIPASTTELLEIAQAAGQLGVKGTQNIKKFTEIMAKLALASDVAGEEGGKGIARILTVTGDGIENVDRFAAALVDLGNNAAASEGEILGVATRVGGAVGAYNASSEGVLGISTALKAMGRQAEEAGSTVGRVFGAIDQSIRNGGKEFKRLQEITGMTGEQLKKTFKEDSTEVFRAFINGLADIEKKGGNTTRELGRFNLQGVRIQATIGTLINKSAVLNENMDRSAKAWAENNALNEEADTAIKSLSAQFTLIKNKTMAWATSVGELLSPILHFFIGQMKDANKDQNLWNQTIDGTATFIRRMVQGFVVLKNAMEVVVGIMSGSFFNGLLAIQEAIRGNFSDALNHIKSIGTEAKATVKKEMTEMEESMWAIEDAYQQKRQEMDADAKAREIEQSQTHQDKLTEIKTKGLQKRANAKVTADTKEITDEQKKMAKLFNIQIKAGTTSVELQKKIDKAKEQARASSISIIAGMASSSNKALAVAGKAAALTQIAIQAPIGVSRALAAFPPPFNYAAAGAVAAAFATQAARAAGVQLADGGIVQARQGGTPAILGEAGYDEAVIPLNRGGGGGIGTTVNFHVGAFVGDESSAREFAEFVDRELFNLRKDNNSLAFDEDIT